MKNRSGFGILSVMLVLALAGAGTAMAAEIPEENYELLYESPVFTGEGEPYKPPETMEKDGKVYELISTRIKSAKKEGTLTFASAVIPYLLEADEEPPETAMITVKEEGSENTFEREVPLLEIKEMDSVWTEDFSFPVVVTGYGADTFYLGETEISGETGLSELGEELLEYLGLPEENYRVDTVEWDGVPYDQEGRLCRNAVAKGARRMRNVELKYGGQIRTPEIEGKQYVGVYRELLAETEAPGPETEPEPETQGKSAEEAVRATEETSGLQTQTGSFGKQIIQWLKQHMTMVTFGGIFFLGIISAASLLYLSLRKRR